MFSKKDLSGQPAHSVQVSPLLRSIRLAGLFYWLLHACLTTLFCFPWVDDAWRLRYKQSWASNILKWLNIKMIASNVDIQPGVMVVSNHISWLDIIVLNAAYPMAFVAKQEVRKWPLIGWLSAKNDTLFIVRGHRKAAHNSAMAISSVLAQSKTVAIFPEGTTSAGGCVQRFHTALFQPACNQGSLITPIAISYHDTPDQFDSHSLTPAYIDDMSIIESMSRIAGVSQLYVRLQSGESIDSNGLTRSQIARLAEDCVASLLHQKV